MTWTASASDPDAVSGRRADGAALAALFALIAVAWWPVLAGRAVFAYDDFVYWFAPARRLVEEALRRGAVAEWDAWVGLGQPLIVNSGAAPLYPLNVLALLGDWPLGLHRMIVAHLFLGGAFTYALARELGARPAAAWVAAAGFAFGGPVVGYAQENPYHLFGLVWVPLVVLAFRRGLRGGGRRAPIAGGAALALVLYGGEPLGWYFTVALLLVVAVALVAGGQATGRRAAAQLVALVGVAVVLAAPQWAASTVGLADSARGQGLPDAVRVAYSFHPGRLPGLLLPLFGGAPAPVNSAWAAGFEGVHRTWFVSVYVGLAAWIFAPAALRRGRPMAWALLAASVLFGWLGLGRFGGLYALADAVVPGLSLLRYPEKFFGPLVITVPVLAALGLEHFLRGEGRRAVGAALVGVGALGAAAWLGAPALEDTVAAIAPLAELVPPALGQIARDGRHVLGAAAGVALALLLRPRARGVAVAAVLAAEVAVAGLTPVITAPPALFAEAGPIVEAVRAEDPHARYRRFPHPPLLPVAADVDGLVANQRRDRWTGGHHSLVGEARVLDRHGLHWGGGLEAILDAADPLPGGALFGARFLVVADGTPPPSWMQAALPSGRLTMRARWSELGAVLLADRGAAPRAWRAAATDVVTGSAAPDALRAMLDRPDLVARVVLDASDALVGGAVTAGAPPRLAGAEPPVGVRWRVDDAEVVEVETEGAAPGVLVLTDAFAPGWHATVDGAAVPIHRALGLGRAVAVPAGHSVVRFRYRHPRLRPAAAMAAVAGAVLALIALLDPRRGAVGEAERRA